MQPEASVIAPSIGLGPPGRSLSVMQHNECMNSKNAGSNQIYVETISKYVCEK